MAKLVIGWISDSHLGCLQYGLPAREEDFFLGLQSALHMLVKEAKVATIIHTGDMFHAARLTSGAWGHFQELHQWLVDRGITCWVIEGNHDQSSPPWLSQNTGLVGGFKLLDNFQPVQDAATGLTLCGCRALPVAEMRERLKLAPVCDLLLVHALVREFVDFDLPGALSLDDFPADKAQMICLGDVHIRKFLPLPAQSPTGVTVEAGYPGSTELGSSAEAEQKTAEILEFAGKTGKLSAHHPKPFRTRPVLRYVVHTADELTTLLTTLSGWHPVLPETRHPLLYLQHAPGVTGVREAVERALDTVRWIVRLSLLEEAEDKAVTLVPAKDGERLQIQTVLEEVMPPGHPLLPIMTRLVDPTIEPTPELLNLFVEARLAS